MVGQIVGKVVYKREVAGFGEPSKYCPHCDSYLTLTSFWKKKSESDGLQWLCLDCKRAYNNVYREKDLRKNRSRRRLTRKVENPWLYLSESQHLTGDYINGSDDLAIPGSEDLDLKLEKYLSGGNIS